MSPLARPRLLFVAPVMPADAGNGLAMRQGQFLAAYAAGFDVDLAVVALAGPVDANPGFAASLVRRWRVFAATAVDSHFGLLARLADETERLAALARYGRPVMAARLTVELLRALAGWAGEVRYDAVHVGRIYLAEAGMAVAATCRVLDADEDDARVWRQRAVLAARQGAAAAGHLAVVEALNAARHAAAWLPGFDAVAVAGAADVPALAPWARKMVVIPNVAVRRMLPRGPNFARGQRLLFVGTMGYGPNEDGLRWFLRHVWPGLRKLAPGVRLDIAGGGASPGLKRLACQPGVRLLGFVDDLAPLYARAALVVAPLRAGGGSRIKLLEAASYGCAMVATSQAAEGLRLRPGLDYVRADGAKGMRRAVLALLGCPERTREMGMRTREMGMRTREMGMRTRVMGMRARASVRRAHSPRAWGEVIRRLISAPV